MKILKICSLILLLTTVLNSCKDVVEPDLSKQNMTLITPPDHDTLADPTITFWWKKIDEQNTYKYRIQIAKPDFTAPQSLLLDSVTTSDKYVFVLSPGKYQWRVRSENGSSATPYATRSLVIDSTKDLSGQQVTIIAPANLSSVYSPTVSFSWNALPAAEYYNIQVVYQATGAIYNLNNVTTNYYSNYALPGYGVYTWKVWANNSSSVSKPSALATFSVTLKPPFSLTNSADSVIAPTPVVLTWHSYAPPSIGDSLLIYKDNTSSTPVVAAYTTANTYSYTSASSGYASGHTYIWMVRSIDASNNTSPWTTGNNFKVK